MKKFLKRICAFSGIFILIGGILLCVGVWGAKGRFEKLSHLTAQTYAYTENVENQIDSITIAYQSNANVRVHFSDTANEISVSYGRLLTKNGKSAGTVTLTDSDGHLQIKESRNWKEKFRTFAWSTSLIKISVDVILPADRTYALAIYANTGNVSFEGAACNLSSLQIISDTADIYLQNTDIVCNGNAKIETDTGDITIGNFIAKDLYVETDTGDIELYDITADVVSLEVDTGDCKILGRLSANVIRITSDTGDINTENNGLLDSANLYFESDTGDVGITIAGSILDYTIFIEVDTGDTNVHTQTGGERKLSIEVDTGDIYVSFENSVSL